MSKYFFAAVQDRRSYYGISKDTPVSDARIQEIVEHAVKHSPSAFNSQSGRVVLLLGKQHDRLWDIVKDALRKLVAPDKFAATEEKINSFQSGYGTILFFEDQQVVKNLEQQFPAYAANFPLWSLQSSGMLQFVVWTGLEAEGLGVSLQHYNPLIDAEVKATWNIPADWRLLSEMPFGKPVAAPGEKTFTPMGERVKVYK
jgi:uncharacterized protein